MHDGKIYLAGPGGGQTVARFNSDGSVDTTFDGDGFARIALETEF
ncbi:MAG: delta-60 repeat domain-containing protein [Ardenticatenales bacterium]|nr:delta-60 repeat domain-containing protein [Ardenticatenales bacterium]